MKQPRGKRGQQELRLWVKKALWIEVEAEGRAQGLKRRNAEYMNFTLDFITTGLAVHKCRNKPPVSERRHMAILVHCDRKQSEKMLKHMEREIIRRMG